MRYQLFRTLEYVKWLEGESKKTKVQIADRLERIEVEGHFGINRHLEGYVWELKWINGRRIYYALLPPKIILLLGGNKNGQDKDIKEAKKIFKSYFEE